MPSRRQRRTDPHLVGEGRRRSGLGRLLTPLATGAAALSLVAVTVATADVDATSASFTDSESVGVEATSGVWDFYVDAAAGFGKVDVTHNLAKAQGSVDFQVSTDGGATWETYASGSPATTSVPAPVTMNTSAQVRAVHTGPTGIKTTTAVKVGTTPNWNVVQDYTGVGDWDGDGNNDIASLLTDGDVHIHPGNGDGTFGGPYKVGNIGPNIRIFTGVVAGGVNTLWFTTTTPGPNGEAGPNYAARRGPDGQLEPTTFEGGAWWHQISSLVYAPKIYAHDDRTFVAATTNIATCAEAPDLRLYRIGDSGKTYNDKLDLGCGFNSIFPNGLIGFGDWDLDGNGDLGGVHRDGRLCLYPSDGNGSLLPGSSHCARSIGSGFTNYHVEGGWDYTGDGLPDLLAKHRTGGALRLYRHPGVPGVNYPVNGGLSTP